MMVQRQRSSSLSGDIQVILVGLRDLPDSGKLLCEAAPGFQIQMIFADVFLRPEGNQLVDYLAVSRKLTEKWRKQ